MTILETHKELSPVSLSSTGLLNIFQIIVLVWQPIFLMFWVISPLLSTNRLTSTKRHVDKVDKSHYLMKKVEHLAIKEPNIPSEDGGEPNRARMVSEY